MTSGWDQCDSEKAERMFSELISHWRDFAYTRDVCVFLVCWCVVLCGAVRCAGNAVSIHKGTVVVGAFRKGTGSSLSEGSAYVYYDGTTAVHELRLQHTHTTMIELHGTLTHLPVHCPLSYD